MRTLLEHKFPAHAAIGGVSAAAGLTPLQAACERGHAGVVAVFAEHTQHSEFDDGLPGHARGSLPERVLGDWEAACAVAQRRDDEGISLLAVGVIATPAVGL